MIPDHRYRCAAPRHRCRHDGDCPGTEKCCRRRFCGPRVCRPPAQGRLDVRSLDEPSSVNCIKLTGSDELLFIICYAYINCSYQRNVYIISVDSRHIVVFVELLLFVTLVKLSFFTQVTVLFLTHIILLFLTHVTLIFFTQVTLLFLTNATLLFLTNVTLLFSTPVIFNSTYYF